MMKSKRVVAMAMLAAVGLSGMALGADPNIDNVVKVMSAANGTNNASLGGYVYDANNQTLFVAGFGANATMIHSQNIDTTSLPVLGEANGATPQGQYISSTLLSYFADDGNPTPPASPPIYGGNAIISAMMINPVTVHTSTGDIPAYSAAWIMDIATPTPVSAAAPAARIYRYDLQDIHNSTDATDIYLHYKTLLYKSDVAQASGLAATTTTGDNLGRQAAWSSDGQSIYFDEAATTAMAGIWIMSAGDGVTRNGSGVPTGGLRRLVSFTGSQQVLCDPWVLPNPGGGDKVFFQGIQGTADVGGVDFAVNTTGMSGGTVAPQQFLSPTTVTNFLKPALTLKSATAADIRAIISDANGTFYFFDNNSTVLFAYDTLGRMYKVTDQLERQLCFGETANPNAAQHLQVRTTTVNGVSVQEIFFADQTSPSSGGGNVAGIYAWQACDFNRDGVTNGADMTPFKAALATRGTSISTDTTQYKFDLNGDHIVDYLDVKIAQQFWAFPNGDSNIDGRTDQTDLNTVMTNWGNTAAKWTTGKFDSGGLNPTTDGRTVKGADLTIIAASWGTVNPTIYGSNPAATRFTADFRLSANPLDFGTGDTATIAARSVATGGTKLVILSTSSVKLPSDTTPGALPTSKLDLVDNDLVLLSTAGSKASDYARVLSLVSNAHNGGLWNNAGIQSSAAAALAVSHGKEYTSLAVVRNDQLATPFTSFDGQTVDSNSILVKYTYVGDVNLDGVVNQKDYLLMDAAYLNGGTAPNGATGWLAGDFDYDGVSGPDDYQLADAALLAAGSPLAADEISAHIAMFGGDYMAGVPEPATLGLLVVGGALLACRRKGGAAT